MRSVLDIVRKTTLMLEMISKESDVRKLEEAYQEILKIDEAARTSRIVIEKEVTDIGAILTNREDFIRLVNCIDKIADISEGVAFRIVGLVKSKMKIDKDIVAELVKLADLVLQSVTKLREALLAVTLNSETFFQKVKETEEAERKVDELYRNIDLTLLMSDMRVGQLLLIREIVSMFEDIADKAEEAVEDLRVLSFVIL